MGNQTCCCGNNIDEDKAMYIAAGDIVKNALTVGFWDSLTLCYECDECGTLFFYLGGKPRLYLSKDSKRPSFFNKIIEGNEELFDMTVIDLLNRHRDDAKKLVNQAENVEQQHFLKGVARGIEMAVDKLKEWTGDL